MNYNYIKAKDLIEQLKYDLEKILKQSDLEGMENRETYYSIENLISHLDKAAEDIKYFNKLIEEGYLQEQPCGEFEICGRTLSCGDLIELWNEEEHEWTKGRVDHTPDKGYYFHNYDMGHPVLYNGLRARIRE